MTPKFPAPAAGRSEEAPQELRQRTAQGHHGRRLDHHVPSSHGHQRPNIREFGWSYAGHLAKLIDGRKWSMRAPPRHDVLGKDGTHARQRVELGLACRIQVHQSAGAAGARRWRDGHTDRKLLAIGQLSSQVQWAQVRTGYGSACGPNGIVHPGARSQPVQTWSVNLSDDVDNQIALTGRRRRSRSARRGRSG
jgi:hypothetical protein